MEVGFVDAGLGYNNPVELVKDEAELVFGDTCRVSCVISIGTGQAGATTYNKPGPFQKLVPTDLVKVLKEIVTASGKTAEAMSKFFRNTPGVYYRFDADRELAFIPLEEWKRLGDVYTHTKNYLSYTNVSGNIDGAVEAILGVGAHETYEIRYLGSQ